MQSHIVMALHGNAIFVLGSTFPLAVIFHQVPGPAIAVLPFHQQNTVKAITGSTLCGNSLFNLC